MLCSQLLGLRSEGQTQALTSLSVPSASTGPLMLAQPESEVGGKGSSPNRINKRQLGFKSLLDNVKKRSQMFLEQTFKRMCLAPRLFLLPPSHFLPIHLNPGFLLLFSA